MTDSRETVLSLSGISKRFGDVVANDAITLELRRGEVLALLGENGAGKSTLVSILFGHYVADAGNVTAFGEPLRGGDPAPRRSLPASAWCTSTSRWPTTSRSRTTCCSARSRCGRRARTAPPRARSSPRRPSASGCASIRRRASARSRWASASASRS